MGGTITWTELGAVAGFLITAGSVVVYFVMFLWNKFNQQEKALADFRLESARTYVTTDALVKVEERLNMALDRLGDKLERLVEKVTTRA